MYMYGSTSESEALVHGSDPTMNRMMVAKFAKQMRGKYTVWIVGELPQM